jgi:hypothetical protein
MTRGPGLARAAAVLCGVMVCAVGLTAVPAAALRSDGPTFIDCIGQAGTFESLQPSGPGRLTVTGYLKPCYTPSIDDRLGIGAFGAGSPHLAGLVAYGPPPAHPFITEVTLPVGTKYVCLLRTPYGAEDCYQVTVTQAPNGTVNPPVVGERTGTAGGALRSRPTKPPGDGFCATCW